jgi:hypothetical protein
LYIFTQVPSDLIFLTASQYSVDLRMNFLKSYITLVSDNVKPSEQKVKKKKKYTPNKTKTKTKTKAKTKN